jgi:hypothetical protein
MAPMILWLIKREKVLNEVNKENEKKTKRQYISGRSHSSIQIAQRDTDISRGEQGNFHLDQAYGPITMYNKCREYFGILAMRE